MQQHPHESELVVSRKWWKLVLAPLRAGEFCGGQAARSRVSSAIS